MGIVDRVGWDDEELDLEEGEQVRGFNSHFEFERSDWAYFSVLSRNSIESVVLLVDI